MEMLLEVLRHSPHMDSQLHILYLFHHTHSNRNLPILVAGGGLKHCGHVDTRNQSGENMPLCNLYLSLLQHFGFDARALLHLEETDKREKEINEVMMYRLYNLIWHDKDSYL